MVNTTEVRTVLKNALDAIDKADIQRARDLIEQACADLEVLEKMDGYADNWNSFRPITRPNDKLLKEFGW